MRITKLRIDENHIIKQPNEASDAGKPAVKRSVLDLIKSSTLGKGLCNA
ncbi:MAG: hypothetical protein K9L25_00895 [Methylovulum sp.]|nr:hypothetical protein [Methylovulum sp.]